MNKGYNLFAPYVAKVTMPKDGGKCFIVEENYTNDKIVERKLNDKQSVAYSLGLAACKAQESREFGE